MRKKNFIMFGLALLSVLGFSSCMNGSNDSTGTAYVFLEVDKYMDYVSYTDPSGLKILPSPTPTTDPTSKLIFAYMEYDSNAVTEGMKQLQVTNFAYSNLTEIEDVYSAPTESTVTCAVSAAGAIWGSGDRKNKYCILPMTFYVKENKADELNKHRFVAYADGANDFSDGVLTIHLRHTVEGLEGFVPEGTTAGSVFTTAVPCNMFFNLRNLLSSVTNGEGNAVDVKKIKIAYQDAKSANVEVIAPDADRVEAVTNEIALTE